MTCSSLVGVAKISSVVLNPSLIICSMAAIVGMTGSLLVDGPASVSVGVGTSGVLTVSSALID